LTRFLGRGFTVGAVIAAALVVAPVAGAQYVNACPDMPPDLVSATDDAIETREQGQRDVTICLAVTERQDALVALQEAAIEDETTTQAQRVALAPVDRNRLDLAWWGSWAIVGTLWALLVAPMMQRAFRWWRE
jgi:hypothetical protein